MLLCTLKYSIKTTKGEEARKTFFLGKPIRVTLRPFASPSSPIPHSLLSCLSFCFVVGESMGGWRRCCFSPFHSRNEGDRIETGAPIPVKYGNYIFKKPFFSSVPSLFQPRPKCASSAAPQRRRRRPGAGHTRTPQHTQVYT